MEANMAMKTDEFMSSINKRDPQGINKVGKSYRVLVVDDSTVMRKIVSQILKSEFYDVVAEASNGEEAVAEYKALKPDLVTLDINMPIMDGLTALINILEIDPDAKVVMLTSESEQKMVLKAIQSGAKNYIVKPPEREIFLEKIKNSLG